VLGKEILVSGIGRGLVNRSCPRGVKMRRTTAIIIARR